MTGRGTGRGSTSALAPMTEAATCARLLVLLRPPSSPAAPKDERLHDLLRQRGWAVDVDWKDDTTTLLAALTSLARPWGVQAVASPTEALDFEATLRFAGEQLARAGLALLRVDNFFLALSRIEHGVEAAARLDALGAAEDGACLFPRGAVVDHTKLLLATPPPKGGLPARRQRLAELVCAEDPMPACTTQNALVKMLARCTVGTRSATGRVLAGWELAYALRNQLLERGLSDPTIRDLTRRAATHFHFPCEAAFLAHLSACLSEHGLSLIALSDARVVVCRANERDEAEAALISFGLATATAQTQELPAFEIRERIDLGLRPVGTSRDPRGQFGEARAGGAALFVDPSVWPPAARSLDLPERASMDAYEDGVQTARGTTEWFHRASPAMPWESFGKPVCKEGIRWLHGRFTSWNERHERLVWSGVAWEPAPETLGRYVRAEGALRGLGEGRAIEGPPGFELVPLGHAGILACSPCFYVRRRDSASYAIVFLEMVDTALWRHPHLGSVSLAYSAEADEVRCVVPVGSGDEGTLCALRISWASLAALPQLALPD